jgi:hypothetical protein
MLAPFITGGPLPVPPPSIGVLLSVMGFVGPAVALGPGDISCCEREDGSTTRADRACRLVATRVDATLHRGQWRDNTRVELSMAISPTQFQCCSRRVCNEIDVASLRCYFSGLDKRHEPTPTSSSLSRNLNTALDVRRRRRRREQCVCCSCPIDRCAVPVVDKCHTSVECKPHCESGRGVHHSVPVQLRPSGGIGQRAGARLLDDLGPVHQSRWHHVRAGVRAAGGRWPQCQARRPVDT